MNDPDCSWLDERGNCRECGGHDQCSDDCRHSSNYQSPEDRIGELEGKLEEWEQRTEAFQAAVDKAFEHIERRFTEMQALVTRAILGEKAPRVPFSPEQQQMLLDAAARGETLFEQTIKVREVREEPENKP